MSIRACLEVLDKLEPGSAERKNLLFTARLLAQLLGEATIIPGYKSDAKGAFRTVVPEIERVLSKPNDPFTLHPDVAIAGENHSMFARTLADTARRLGNLRSADGSRLLWACLDIEADLNRRAEDFYRAELAAATPGHGAQTSQAPEFDLEHLPHFLSERCGGQPIAIGRVRRIPGGFSKITLLLELVQNGPYPKSIVLRLDKKGGFLGTKVADEFAVLERLYCNEVCVPKPLLSEPTGEVIGSPFIVVAAVPGATIGDMFNLPAANAAVNASIATELARLHRVPLTAMDGALKGIGKTTREQASEWLRQSLAAWEGLEAPSGIIDTAFDWLTTNLSLADGDSVVMHGDLGLNNILIDNNNVTALVDWEFVCAGHAAYDLGYFHCMASALGSWEDFLDHYRDAGGKVPLRKTLDFFILFANVRLAVMVWQGAVGFMRGQLKDIMWGNVVANDLRTATMRVVEQMKIIARHAESV
jgi:aminoglycoside phosphotransferase (APT) family kinase protein